MRCGARPLRQVLCLSQALSIRPVPENIRTQPGGDPREWGVVIVNWNTSGDTIDCLRSVCAAADTPRQIVVVDNASSDGSVARIEEWARQNDVRVRVVSERELRQPNRERLLLLASTTVRGFSANNNLGLRFFRDYTVASHVLLLNNDATVATDFFSELSAVVARRPRGGLFTGTIFHDPDRARVWYAGGRINPLRALVTHATAMPATAEALTTAFVCGCAMLISREVMAAIGLLPECFDPIYCEDADYSLRAGAAGFDLVYAPRAVVYHKVGATVGETSASPRTTFSTNRNRAFLIRRNYRGLPRAAGLAYLLATKPVRALVDAARGRPRIGWAVLSGMLAGVFGRNAHAQSR